ncbi:PepSY-associated TM helix domain-containing protein [Phytopseudomonas punonensis]|uniref:Uncharacterized iron-regulated membrane protein n=1 Tax=Phytopseudomonas punonensis TaxID=1220495 RepID=A0A1M7ATL5_9GAMM|nr:PepSY-associated TM helix domain-containing protein [Pseudomonas punonensis]SHL46092.1 Uncharacterized iron-regulated membrane protein [Pseudomonas punonensis]
MKEGFRQSMAWLHTWTGLVVGWVLFFVFVTGTAGYVDDEITRWMEPERPLQVRIEGVERGAMLERALQRLEQVASNAKSWTITLPHTTLRPRGEQGLAISWEDLPEHGHDYGRRGGEELNARTGLPRQEVEPRETGGGGALYEMHYVLHYMPYNVGITIVGVCTMLMLLAILTGVITHKKIFKDFFTFRPGKGQRSWLDAHNVISVMALPFFLMITYSGLIFFVFNYMPAAAVALYGTGKQQERVLIDELFGRDKREYLPASRPQVALDELVQRGEAQWPEQGVASLTISQVKGEPARIDVQRILGGSVNIYDPVMLSFAADGQPAVYPDKTHGPGKTHRMLIGLHEGLFADWWLRWLYLVAGLLGCGMIGTGLVLWTVKRRNGHLKRNDAAALFDAYGLRLVEVLNVGTLVGLPTAVAAYFWANRLLPVGMAERASWEMHCLFLTWGWLFLYASLRPLKKAWLEMAWMAVAAFGLIPLINALTTDRHLGVTLAEGDWVLAGFDLSMLGLAALFAYGAMKIRRRWLKADIAAVQAGKEALA